MTRLTSDFVSISELAQPLAFGMPLVYIREVKGRPATPQTNDRFRNRLRHQAKPAND